ncbi:MAG TPA: glycosyl transferase family 4 [Alphaproteobacteria bacterium]|nr:glycosyl transferase family 4 [Alphaproteobacteria bacterium]
MPFVGPLIVIAAGIVAYAAARWLLRHAGRIGLVAEVNERSSHTRPTPSGGGVGIVAAGTIGALPAIVSAPTGTLVVAGLALVIAAIGFIDDRRPIPAAIRLAAQLALAAAMVAVLPAPGVVVGVVLVLAAVYCINVFNFMDGIDGIAGTEAAFVLVAASALAVLAGAPAAAPLVWWMLALAAATLGFLVLNWPPAKIFMGDSGSTYLGFMLAWFALATVAAGWLTAWQWAILGALFIADATITLMRRALRGEPLFKAHRLHAYQHLSRRWGRHRPVTLLYLAVNVVLLLPLAVAAGALPGLAPAIAAIAYLPVLAGLLWAGAGAPEAPSRTSS